MPRKLPHVRIAITLPPETLRAADQLAKRHDRSRSWIVAEAIRRYAASLGDSSEVDDAAARLGPSRHEQLRRDVRVSPDVRVRESEEIVSVGGELAEQVSPRSFASYDAFRRWRRRRQTR
ncbi:MAG: CopG family transcriptional regulator [Gemmatimonadaceae bacterium]|nr:CopG family transcriptional regulator [Gemmatimonadaceae bacterium]